EWPPLGPRAAPFDLHVADPSAWPHPADAPTWAYASSHPGGIGRFRGRYGVDQRVLRARLRTSYSRAARPENPRPRGQYHRLHTAVAPAMLPPMPGASTAPTVCCADHDYAYA